MHSSLILPFLLSLLLLICCANAAAETHEHDRSEDLTEIHANCSSIIVHATIDANASHVAFTGVANNSNYDCFAPNVTKRDVSFFTVYSKRLISFRDVNNEIQRGKVCNVSIRGWAHAINATDKVDFNLPVVDNRTTIECFMSLETPSSSTTPTPTKTIEAHHHHTTTTTTTTSHHRATTTHHTTESTTTTTTTTTTHHRTTHKPTTTTTTTTKKAKPTHSSDDDDDDDANWVTGEVTFFTPDNGACENDKETMIAALGPGLYGNMDSVSKYCNKKIEIIGPKGNSITVTVADACPPCDDGHLDLSPDAFGKLGEYDIGVLDVKWRFLD